jgi:AAA family ATP:ADP antiporter
VPVYGAIVARFPRRLVVPVIYAFFIANLIMFWLALGLSAAEAAPAIGQVFFVWSSVFNLFVVSLFWVLMSELYSTSSAKRLYGFIAAGGTAGAVTGPLIARTLAGYFAPHDLLLVSALFLSVALVAVLVLRRVTTSKEDRDVAAEVPAGGRDILSGAISVVRSPYLFRIALFILLANLIGTYFYLEQSRIVGEDIADKAERIQFFASRDFAVNFLTIIVQVLLTGRIMERFGLAVPLAALPLTAICGLVALAISPALYVVAAVMVAERAIAFSITNPAVKVLWTAVPLDEKYKAQNFIDTAVYRGGDAASGWVFNSFAKSVGASGAVIATLPFALLWLYTGVSLGREQKAKAVAATAGP